MKYEAGKAPKMTGDKENYRYVLQQDGKKTLVVLGVNPSTASDERTDPTIDAVLRIVRDNKGYDSFAMINLYPKRSSKVSNLPAENDFDGAEAEKNCDYIRKLVEKNRDVLLAFGNCIEERKYLATCFRKIVEKLSDLRPNYKIITLTGDGNPCHPLYAWRCKNVIFAPNEDRSYLLQNLDDVNSLRILKK